MDQDFLLSGVIVMLNVLKIQPTNKQRYDEKFDCLKNSIFQYHRKIDEN